MVLKAPNLDDRKFQDIVSEARSKIPLYCPKWTDYNLSDPGITLIELFAWMVDMLLFRLNRVPEKNYIKFMELIGIHLEPPKPANVDITFRLSAPQPEAVTIPRGTEVATVRTETQEAVTFSTDRDLTIILPTLAYALTASDEAAFDDCLPALKNPDRLVNIFQEVPEENNALYLGYSENLGAHTLALTIESSMEGIGVDPRNPPLAWEYWDGAAWSSLTVTEEVDNSNNFTATNGSLYWTEPSDWAKYSVNGSTDLYYIRTHLETGSFSTDPIESFIKTDILILQYLGDLSSNSQTFTISSEPVELSEGSIQIDVRCFCY